MRKLKRITKIEILISDSGDCCVTGFYGGKKCGYFFKNTTGKYKCARYSVELAHFRSGAERCSKCKEEFGY